MISPDLIGGERLREDRLDLLIISFINLEELLIILRFIHRNSLFLQFSMNGLFGAIRTEFFRFQSSRCISTILLGSISRNTRKPFITIIPSTTSTFQSNYYSCIFTFSHRFSCNIESQVCWTLRTIRGIIPIR